MQQHVVVLGGGVIGISTAIALLDHPDSPCNVTLIASDMPLLDIGFYTPGSSQAAPSSFASAWAGAHHVSDAKDKQQLKRDKDTFKVLQLLEEKKGFGKDNAALVWVYQTEYWEQKEDYNAEAIEWYPDYKPLSSSALPNGVAVGCTLSTYDLVVPQYLPRIFQLFNSLGGRSINAKVGSVKEAVQISEMNLPFNWAKPSAIVVSPGLGAADLLGDKQVYPARGQTVLVRSPWCTTKFNKQTSWASNSPNDSPPDWSGMSRVNKNGFRDMYILPRGDGTFIVGGTRLVNDWDTQPRQETSREILKRALEFMPLLDNPEKDDPNEESNLDVIGVNVGLRPARNGGVRLEVGEKINDIAVIYSYGYGGYGYQCSWGAAFEARNLVDDALKRPRAPSHTTLASLDSS